MIKVNKFTNTPYQLILLNIFLASTFFPYVTPFKTPFSLQPYSLIMGLLLILTMKIYRKGLPYWLWLPFMTLLGAISIAAMGGELLNVFRSIYNYASFAILLPIYIYLVKNRLLNLMLWLRIASFIYFAVGVVQIYIDTSFMSCCVANIENQSIMLLSGRGVASLTPEPTFFGFVSGILLMLSLMRRDALSVTINIVSIIFISRSSLAIFCLIFALILFSLFKSNLKIKFIVFSTTLIAPYFIGSMISSEARFFLLANNFLEQGVNAFDYDESSAGRLYHITQPIISFINSYGLPNGYVGLPNGDVRILSGFGSAIYELGFMAFPLFYTICYVFFYSTLSKNNLKIFYFGFLMLIWINANQIGMPLIILWLALLKNDGLKSKAQ